MNPRIHITRNNLLVGSSSPVGVITPDFMGQEYAYDDGVVKKIFKAKGLTSDDWLELGEVPEIDLSDYATNAKVDGINDEVQQNKTSILSLQNELNGARLDLINSENSIINKLV